MLENMLKTGRPTPHAFMVYGWHYHMRNALSQQFCVNAHLKKI